MATAVKKHSNVGDYASSTDDPSVNGKVPCGSTNSREVVGVMAEGTGTVAEKGP